MTVVRGGAGDMQLASEARARHLPGSPRAVGEGGRGGASLLDVQFVQRSVLLRIGWFTAIAGGATLMERACGWAGRVLLPWCFFSIGAIYITKQTSMREAGTGTGGAEAGH